LLAANEDFIDFFNADVTQKGHGAEASRIKPVRQATQAINRNKGRVE